MPLKLPAPLTRFIGREREITEISLLMDDARLITLTGPPGCGKTRLAIESAKAVRDRFRDGVFWVNLVPIADPDLVPQTVALALEVDDEPALELTRSLAESLEHKHLLLVLDNCEHLTESCAALVHTVLQVCPTLYVLVTSQEPLRVPGEVVRTVPPLSTPDADAASIGALRTYEATALFLDRAQKTRAGFQAEEGDAKKLIQICEQLDGNPLAIELASAQVDVHSLGEILEGLDDRLSTLVDHRREGKDPRHISLQAAIEWSYGLLDLQEQRLLRRLSVFSGGFGLSAAEEICWEENFNGKENLATLHALIDKSMVTAETVGRIHSRYHLLETIRLFGLEKMEESEAAELRDRHLDFYLTWVEGVVGQDESFPEKSALNLIGQEYDNLRAALDWSIHSKRIEAGFRLATASSEFWSSRGQLREGLALFDRLNRQADENVSPIVQMKALVRASTFAMFLGEEALAKSYARDLTELGERAIDREDPDLILALGGLISSAHASGDYQTAFSLQEQAIRHLRDSDDEDALGMVLVIQGGIAVAIGEFQIAKKVLQEGMSIAEEAGDSFRTALALCYQGDLARCEGNYNLAKRQYERSIALFRELSPSRDLASVLNNLGFVKLHFGDISNAFDLYSEALEILRKETNIPGMAESLIGFGALAVLQGLSAQGVQLLAAGDRIGGKRISNWGVTRMEFEKYLALGSKALTEPEYHQERSFGSLLSLEEALTNVERMSRLSKDAPHQFGPGVLTRRERQTAGAVARGLSNDEIAAEFMVSPRTVEKHVSNILSKLSFSNRSQIVRWAIERGLVDRFH